MFKTLLTSNSDYISCEWKWCQKFQISYERKADDECQHEDLVDLNWRTVSEEMIKYLRWKEELYAWVKQFKGIAITNATHL